MPSTLRRTALIVIHVLAWTAIIVFQNPSSLRRMVGLDAADPSAQDVRIVLLWTLLIAVVYLNHYVFIPKLFEQGRRWWYAISVVAGLVVVLSVPALLAPPDASELGPLRARLQVARQTKPTIGNRTFGRFAERRASSLRRVWLLRAGNFALLYIVAVLASLSYRSQVRFRKNEALMLRSEVARLRGQIQPHFLFNTLNSIYALAVRNDPGTGDAIVTLSQFLRYLTESSHLDKVDLSRELEYLENYLKLQRSRLRETADISYTVEGEPADVQLAPLLLFTFVENAFVHGVSPEQHSPIRIHLSIVRGPTTTAATVHLHVENSVIPARSRENTASNQPTGLANARERLALVYPGKYTLDIGCTDGTFMVDLTIQTS